MIHLYLPDSQVKPSSDTSFLRWIGLYIVDHFVGKELTIIHAGDFADMESLSSYDKPGSKSMEGRRYAADIDAATHAFALLNEPLEEYNLARQRNKQKQWWPRRVLTLGNHEARITKAIEQDPRLEGTISLGDLPYTEKGWEVIPFLEPIEIDGIFYVHYWYNPLTGRPWTGSTENMLKTIGHSFVQGHRQTLQYSIRFVAGRSQHGLIAGACYLDDEDFKGPQGNSHWRGVVVMHEVFQGSFDPMFVSLNYLKKRYAG